MSLQTILKSICILLLAVACTSHDPAALLSEQEYGQLVQELTPYVNKKPDHASYEERFSESLKPYYSNLLQSTDGRVRFYKQHGSDSLHYFYYVRKDYTSLFEHYYGFGGVFKKDQGGKISYLKLFFQTPRLSKEEEAVRGKALFDEMISAGNADKYVGNKDYVKTPNEDFYYNDRENRWDYTENSSWKFLHEAKEYADAGEGN